MKLHSVFLYITVSFQTGGSVGKYFLLTIPGLILFTESVCVECLPGTSYWITFGSPSSLTPRIMETLWLESAVGNRQSTKNMICQIRILSYIWGYDKLWLVIGDCFDQGEKVCKIWKLIYYILKKLIKLNAV